MMTEILKCLVLFSLAAFPNGSSIVGTATVIIPGLSIYGGEKLKVTQRRIFTLSDHDYHIPLELIEYRRLGFEDYLDLRDKMKKVQIGQLYGYTDDLNNPSRWLVCSKSDECILMIRISPDLERVERILSGMGY